MPALPNAIAIIRAAVTGTVNGAPFQNVFHVQYTGAAPSVANLGAFCSALGGAWDDNFSPLCPTTVELTGVDAQDLTTPLAASAVAVTPATATRAGTAMPNNVAACITWHINVRYRGGHPRTYLPAGVIADVLGGNRWTDAFVNDANTAADGFLTDVNAITTGGITYKLVCLSYTRDKVALAVPVPYTIQSGLVDHRPDTQRRRLGRDIAA